MSTSNASRVPSQREARSASTNQRTMLVIIGVITAAVIVAIVAIVLSSSGSNTVRDYSTVPQARLDDGGFVLGDPNAPVTIVEFADFTCPHCQSYHEEVTTPLIEQYVLTGMAKFEYRMFPIVDPTFAEYSAQIAECASELKAGGFWEAHDILFNLARAGRLSQTTARTVADGMGIAYSDLLNCTRTADQFQTDLALGQRMGIQGTPAIMIRYGDSAPQFITLSGTTYNRGGVPFNVLQAVIQGSQQS